MEFDYTEYEYLPECTVACGALSDWLPSNDAAHEVGLSHEKQTGHHCRIQQRMKEVSPPVNQEPKLTRKG